MERKVVLYWLAQTGGWSAYYIFSVLILLTTAGYKPTQNLFLWICACIVFSMLLSHGLRWVILKLDLLSRKLPVLLGYTIFFSFLAAFALESFQYFLDNTIELDFVVEPSGKEDFTWAMYVLAATRSMILFALWSGFYYVFVIIEKSRKQELLNLQWQASKNEIELKNLRAQLNPHFLFNSLNSIRALVAINPDQAKTAITQLSGLLRNSISLGKLRLISFKDELELVDNYLKLEQIRFEERLQIQMQVDDSVRHCQVPPLMLQTIVENAIKHGISKSINGGKISVAATKIENTVTITIDNTGTLNTKSDGEEAVGLSNTRKRLAILFGEHGEFNLFQYGELVRAQIKITYV